MQFSVQLTAAAVTTTETTIALHTMLLVTILAAAPSRPQSRVSVSWLPQDGLCPAFICQVLAQVNVIYIQNFIPKASWKMCFLEDASSGEEKTAFLTHSIISSSNAFISHFCVYIFLPNLIFHFYSLSFPINYLQNICKKQKNKKT